MLVFIYLCSIVAANLSVAYFGPAVTPINAFLFIGLDLVTRDALHERWRGRHLWLNMAALILAGSAISYALNAGAGRIALASCVAFAAAGAVDALAYHLLRHRPWWQRSNGSNVPSAIADSILFPTIAFSQFLPGLILLQVVAKIGGGLVWSMVLRRRASLQAIAR